MDVTGRGFPFTFDPLSCRDCGGRCCRGSSGKVWLTQDEAWALAGLLKIPMIDAMERFFIWQDNRLCLREVLRDEEWWCVFLMADGGCRVYPARPAQCRSYPFWPKFRLSPELVVSECPGVRLVEP